MSSRSTGPRSTGLALVLAVITSLVVPLPAAAATDITSDDFSVGLDSSVWSVVDPVGDGSVVASGQGTSDAWVQLSVPSGTSHDPWGVNRSLRLMQSVGDGDFEVEAKFDSVPAVKYQMQGLIVEQDADEWLRFDTYHDGRTLRVLAASTSGGRSRWFFNDAISVSGGSVWLRVTRTGDTWTMWWSDDGSMFTDAGSFSRPMTVSKVGPFAANHKPNPAYTARVDYVFDTAAPIAPEDPVGDPAPDTTAPVISGVGVSVSDTSATVSWTTDEPATSTVAHGPTAAYEDGSVSDGSLVTAHQVDLTGLVPDTTYHFQAASVDAAGNASSSDGTFTTSAAPAVTHTLTTDVVGQGVVTRDPDASTHEAGSVVSLTATPASGWSFAGWSEDVTSTDNPLSVTMDTDVTVTATFVEDTPVEEPPGDGPALVSDDFSVGLDSSVWSVVDPVGDGSVVASGQGTSDAWVQLSVPSGTSHDPWGVNRSLRLMQSVGDGDFEVEAKFDSVPFAKYQQQGLIVEQDADDWLRFDTYHDGSSLRAFAASTVGGRSSAKLSVPISVSGGSVWLRVGRTGDTWTMWWSDDGAAFKAVGSFDRGLSASSAGPFAANHKPNPAYTARVDYVFDTATPIDPEDGYVAPTHTIATTTVGEGTVDLSPTGPDYAEGTSVEVTAVPNPGWVFTGWSGDLQGTANPSIVEVTTDLAITASFSEGTEPVRIMAVGDSITRGIKQVPAGTQGTYRRYLTQHLSASGLVYDMVGQYASHPSGAHLDEGAWDHDSHSLGGWRSANIRDNIQTQVAAYDPDVMLVLIGINDLFADIDPATVASRIELAIERARVERPDLSVMLAQIPPASASYDAAVAGLNEQIAALGPSLSTALSPVHVVDLHTSFDAELHHLDSVHPNDAGDRLLATRWADALHTHLALGDEPPAPVLSDLAVTTTATSATITWATDGPATSDVAFGQTEAHELGTIGAEDLVVDHSVTLEGLDPDATYHFQVSSTDAVDHTTTTTDTFTTASPADTTPPGVADLVVTTTDTTASLAWSTDESARSSIRYGTPTPDQDVTVSSDFVTDHAVTLTDLAAETTYVFEVIVTDAAGNTAVGASESFTTTSTPMADGPVIDVWYGDEQSFGGAGQPQPWVNILGNTHDPDGVSSLGYRLNGGALQSLSLGPNLTRLQFAGDFNAEIAYGDLVAGANTLELVATDGVGEQSTRVVTVSYTPGIVPTVPQTYDWGAGALTDIAQVVDGRWSTDGGVLRPLELGYDRLVAVGDRSWTDYEVEVPLTVHGLGPDSGTPQSGAPLVGMALRWVGHTKVGTEQPSKGFYPVGAYAWFRWQKDGRTELTGSGGTPIHRDATARLPFGVPHVMKASVETLGTDTRYRYKMWPASDPEPAWQLEIVYPDGEPRGSVALIAHHVDVSFGTLRVSPLP